MKKIHELRENKRVQALRGKIAAPKDESTDEYISPSRCFHCGAELPRDMAFQEFHMAKEHGLIS